MSGLMVAALNDTLAVSSSSVAPNGSAMDAGGSSGSIGHITTNATSSDAAAQHQAAVMAKQMLLDYLSKKFHLLQVFLVLGYFAMFTLCIVLITYLRYNRSVALKGDSIAARKIILPAFEPLLWILGFATGLYTLFTVLALSMVWFRYSIPPLVTECIYSGRQFVFLIVVVYMLQKSVSIPALRRTVVITLVLSTYTIPLQYALLEENTNDEGQSSVSYFMLTAGRGMLMFLYLYIAIWPPGRASKRTIREYCMFAFIYYTFTFTYGELFRSNLMEEAFAMTYVTILWGAMCPLVIWRVLKADTEHWRGMGQRACALQSVFRQKHQFSERISSQGLHVLIEMHRKYIIDFAYLKIQEKIGMGSSATVFNGVLHPNVPVAIKVYTPANFTEDTVAEFSHEAALCGALNHPNIVKFYGMCVFPPAICLVSELCQGSLDDVTRANLRHHNSGRELQHTNRQQPLINLGYMIDAARAVAYLHSFSPAFLHRDIKPSNFMVDAENNVKLTDFGESRSLAKAAPCVQGTASDRDDTVTMLETSAENLRHEEDGVLGISTSYRPATALMAVEPVKMTVKGTVDYMAPELIKGKAGLAEYGEAADVYSLAMTMWDIINPGAEKFPTLKNNHLQVFEFVIDGKRPHLEEHSMHPGLRQVIESAWHTDPRMRPSAQNIVHILESIQEELHAVFAQELMNELKMDMVAMSNHGDGMPTLFTGEHAVSRMEDMNYVDTTAEAIRLGNALMDAGLLHHQQHARGFENADALYFFDEDNIILCKPICVQNARDYEQAMVMAIREDDAAGAATTPSNNQIPYQSILRRSRQYSEYSTGSSRSGTTERGGRTGGRTAGTRSDRPFLEHETVCMCRKYGQRLENLKASRRRFRRKFKAISEENVLTVKLLAADTGAHTIVPDFGEFDAVDPDLQA